MIWYEVKASEARQGKRIDELRDDMKASETRQRDDIKTLMVRQQQDMADLKADNRSLGEKLDRLLESLLAARQR